MACCWPPGCTSRGTIRAWSRPAPRGGRRPPPPRARAGGAYVGGAACTSCHAKEAAAWQGSHHDRAMAVASEATVLGRFDGTNFRHQGVTSTFFKRDGKFFVNTDGPDGKLADFEIKYTFGVDAAAAVPGPLPGGRLQALGIAWDTRPAAQGGQRWFHLYPDRKLEARRPAALDRHRPGLELPVRRLPLDEPAQELRREDEPLRHDLDRHQRQLRGLPRAGLQPPRVGEAGRRLAALRRCRQGPDRWRSTSAAAPAGRSIRATGNAARSKPRETSREIETCARCHARRGQFTDAWHAGEPLADGFRTSLIEPGLYFADGQMRDEVFNHGSFLGSKMHAKGVTCSDCHDPHTPEAARAGQRRVRASATAPRSTTCHRTTTMRRAPAAPRARRATCRRRPTWSSTRGTTTASAFRGPTARVSLGVPNACNACHADRKPQWAADAVKAWFPQPKPGFQTFAEAFSAAERGEPGASAALAGSGPGPRAVGLCARQRGPPAGPATCARPRCPRCATRCRPGCPGARRRGRRAGRRRRRRARAVAGAAAGRSGAPGAHGRGARAGRRAGGTPARHDSAQPSRPRSSEYEAAERFNADRPEGRANLGNLYATAGALRRGRGSLPRALALDPSFEQAALNLADLQRGRRRGGRGRADAARARWRATPARRRAHHALGLSLARQNAAPRR